MVHEKGFSITVYENSKDPDKPRMHVISIIVSFGQIWRTVVQDDIITPVLDIFSVNLTGYFP